MDTLSYLDIVDRLKKEIIRGTVLPGQRLPTRVKLERRFNTTPVTLNRAMQVLMKEGFVKARMGSGTHVAPHPPHLSLYALAFPFESLQGVSRFYEALRDEAAKLKTDERRVSAFYGIASHVDVEDYQRLLESVRAQRLAGLIFAGNPYQLTGSPLIRDRGLLRTAIMSPDGHFPFPTVYPDINDFLPKAFDYLASRGRKRVAVVVLGASSRVEFEPVHDLASQRGLILRSHWLQAAFPGAKDWARQSAMLLLHQAQTERPDAIVITDDNLVGGFTEGIRDSGIPVVGVDEPRRTACGERGRTSDLEVVAQANFPYPTPSAVPAKRLGINISQLLAICLERIEQQRRGESVPSHTALPVEFETSRS
jgi:DNA-binding transcriptional regulator YhcF (GntR family)